MKLNSRVLSLIIPCRFILVETDPKNAKSARAVLSINDICENNTPDFEKFDTVYISIQVTDINQNINRKTDTGM